MRLTLTTLLAMVMLAASATAGAGVIRDHAAKRLGTARITRVYTSRSCRAEVFNRDGGGFAIVTADGVVGYNESGSFDPSKAPTPLLDMIENMTEADGFSKKNVKRSDPVAPLLGDIAWDQNHPYNLLCPPYFGKEKPATGCAATAMAQIMRYHSYPERGRGSHSYTPELYPKMGTISVDFSQSVYDWANMTPRYDENSTEEEMAAVARLMFDAGVAISMEYGPMSGALSQEWPEALVKYFDYDKGVALRFRANYDFDDWNSLIYDEISAGRPVYATGFSSDGGHAFVFDGYDENGFVHVNWGWSAMSNGYFDTNFLTPATQGTGGSSGGFNSRQLIVTGICPPVAGSEPAVTLVSEEGLTAPRKAGRNEAVTVKLNGKIENAGWQDSAVDFSLMLVSDAGGDTLKTYPGPKDIVVALQAPHRNLLFENIVIGNIPEGDYRLVPVACRAGGRRVERLRDKDTSYPNYLNVTVSGDYVSFSSPAPASLRATALETDGSVYSFGTARITASLSNDGDSEYYGSITPVLIDPASGKRVASAAPSVFDLMPGTESDIELYAVFEAVPGEYLLNLIDNNYTSLATPLEITLHPSSDLYIEAVEPPDFGNNDAVDHLDVRAGATVGCGDGMFTGLLFLYIYALDGETVKGCIGPEFVQITDGATRHVTFTGRFENGMPGEEYDACLVNAENFTFVTPRDRAKTRFRVAGTTSVTDVMADEALPARYYSIQGAELSSPPATGIYIEVRGNRAVKKIAK